MQKEINSRGKSVPSFTFRHAKALLFVCLTISFLVPYAAVSMYQSHIDRKWASSGMSGYEISEWRKVGIDDVDEAVRWRNWAFKPGHASIWRSEGFTPEEAGPWEKGGFHTGDAKIWGKHGFSAIEAKSWRDNGFYYPEAEEWKSKGVTAEEAAARKIRRLKEEEDL